MQATIGCSQILGSCIRSTAALAVAQAKVPPAAAALRSAVGENFTVDGLDEANVCIGDIHEVGEARIQVTEPRYPCVKISRRWGIPTLTARVAETGRTGWYCRVLREGWVEPRVSLVLVDRLCPSVTVAMVNDFGHGRNRDVAAARQLTGCPLLQECWQLLVVRGAMG